jgi:DMSO/TMAO reductase YedYZ molybdopterin-dependent catalytic subunit
MEGSRRRFLKAAGLVFFPWPQLAAQSQKGMIVRASRPEDLEMQLEGFGSWITPVEQFFVRSHHYLPQVDAAQWRLRVEGEVANPLTLTMADLRQLPRAELTGVLECAGNGRGSYEPHVPGVQWQFGAVGNARWAGVRLADVLKKAGVNETTREILFDGADAPIGSMPKFQRGIPVKKALDENTLLAFEMNGQPLAPQHGFPLRVIAPGWAGDSWVKWVTRIQALNKPFEGFWMTSAYRHPGHAVTPGAAVDPKQMQPVTSLRVKSVIASPPDGFFLGLAPVRIRGAAWAGESPVSAVDVSADFGRTWKSATLGRDDAPFAWRLWDFSWTPEREGYYVLMARARDTSGDVQPLAAEWDPSGYLWNAVQQVGVTISSAPPDVAAMGRRINAHVPAPPPVSARQACLVCHEADLIDQQKLTPQQWEKEVDKMVRWGAKVKPADREQILNWLVQFGPR